MGVFILCITNLRTAEYHVPPLEEHFSSNTPGLFVCLELYSGIFITHFASKKNIFFRVAYSTSIELFLTKLAGPEEDEQKYCRL